MKTLGRYEITGELGRGGMGIVYRAIDTTLGRAVAIKAINLSEQGTAEEARQLRERLLREARAAAGLSHPNVVTVHDVGQEGDIAYIVMEVVEGRTLEGALADPEAVRSQEFIRRVLEDTARGLDYAHAHGIVHRDVKPGNILIQNSGGVKIGDFGVAKVTWGRTITETGMLVGSPHYMAPEQLKGERVTGRTDQFALAAVAYMLLTGHKAFDGDTFASLASKILFEPAPSPSIFNSWLPPEVEQVLAKAMSKDPAARYDSCTQFVQHLKSALGQSAPLPAAPPAKAGEGEKAPPVRRWVVAAAAAVGVLILIFIGAYLFLQQRARRAEAAYWESIKARSEVAAFQAYLKQYPQGRFASLAKAELERLRKAAAAVSHPVVEPKPTTNKVAALPKVPPVKPKPPEPVRDWERLNANDGLRYAKIPAGSFEMGCSPGDDSCEPDESPRHRVTITNGFWMGETEVTVAAYRRFSKSMGKPMPDPDTNKNPDYPVVLTTLREEEEYCKWAGGRLPTEAEWEYAARGGSAAPLYGDLDAIAWHRGNADDMQPVGKRAPNRYHLYDMIGNVWERVSDRYGEKYYAVSEATDPQGPAAGSEGERYVVRGGSSHSSGSTLRSSRRAGQPPDKALDTGFRCVLRPQ